METCSTCKWWITDDPEWIRRTGDAYCAVASGSGLALKLTRGLEVGRASIGAEAGYEAVLFTDHDFGCTEHEEKE